VSTHIRPGEAQLWPLDKEKLIHVFEASPRSEIRFRLTTLKGVRRADVRWFVKRKGQRKDGWGEPEMPNEWQDSFVATRKGVSLPVENLPELFKGVQLLVEASKQ
jgi:hypothetical protein